MKGMASLVLLCCCTGAPRSHLAETPRADENLELLALSVSGTVVARQDIYDRVVHDLSAIRAFHPEVRDIAYRPRDGGKSLILGVDAATSAAIDAGTYHDWDGLNARWHLVERGYLIESAHVLLLEFPGIYDMGAVGQDYAGLRGVTCAEPNIIGGDGSTICLTLEGDWYRYVFDRATGDCPAGCTIHHEFGFSTGGAGAINFEAEWDSTTRAVLPDFIRRFGLRAGTSCKWSRGR